MWRVSQRKNSLIAQHLDTKHAVASSSTGCIACMQCCQLRQVRRGIVCLPQKLEIFDSTVWSERALAFMPQEDS